VCFHSPAIFAPYLTDRNETTEDGSILCQRLSEIETTARQMYYVVKAASWLKKNFPRVP